MVLFLLPNAFFPFADNIGREIAKAGIKAINQPGGSVLRDQRVYRSG